MTLSGPCGGRFAASVDDAHDYHNVVFFNVFVNDDIRPHEGNADACAELGPKRAAVRKLRQAPIEIVKSLTIAASGVRARLSV